MSWINIIDSLTVQNMWVNDIPHNFTDDSIGDTVLDTLKMINSENKEKIPENLYPIYGGFEQGYYEGSAFFILVNPELKQFYEISGSHCSCYGFEGQFNDPSLVTIEMFNLKGSNYSLAKETVIKVAEYFVNKEKESN